MHVLYKSEISNLVTDLNDWFINMDNENICGATTVRITEDKFLSFFNDDRYELLYESGNSFIMFTVDKGYIPFMIINPYLEQSVWTQKGKEAFDFMIKRADIFGLKELRGKVDFTRNPIENFWRELDQDINAPLEIVGETYPVETRLLFTVNPDMKISV